ncbi:MAG: hypothetical protein HYX56_05325 [Chloroflexi bacterium]|nr:hypothetical protein [Chloroflexota bacterium]
MIVAVVTVALLAASLPLISMLRSLEGDRATAVRVLYSILVVLAFAALPVAWALGALPTAALLAYVAAPLAMRLGDTVSHRSGAALSGALREGIILVLLFAAIVVGAVFLSS